MRRLVQLMILTLALVGISSSVGVDAQGQHKGSNQSANQGRGNGQGRGPDKQVPVFATKGSLLP